MNVNYLEATFEKGKVGDTLTFTLERRTNIGERAELKKATITNNLTEKKTTSFLSICLLKKVNRKRVKGKLSSKRKEKMNSANTAVIRKLQLLNTSNQFENHSV